MSWLKKIKTKIIHQLGGYTLQEYYNAIYTAKKPVCFKLVEPDITTITAKLENWYIAKDLDCSEESAKKELAICLAKQIIDGKDRFVVYRSENDFMEGKIIVVEKKNIKSDNEVRNNG